MMELPDPWDIADAMGAPSKDEVRREMWEDHERGDPIEGEPCSLCGKETVHPIYEIINVTTGGEVVGIICSDCGKKFSIKPNETRRDTK